MNVFFPQDTVLGKVAFFLGSLRVQGFKEVPGSHSGSEVTEAMPGEVGG